MHFKDLGGLVFMDTLSQLFGVKHDLPGQFAGNNESEGIGDEEGGAEEDL